MGQLTRFLPYLWLSFGEFLRKNNYYRAGICCEFWIATKQNREAM